MLGYQSDNHYPKHPSCLRLAWNNDQHCSTLSSEKEVPFPPKKSRHAVASRESDLSERREDIKESNDTNGRFS